MGSRVKLYLQIITLAFRNIIRNPRHSFATVLAISTGFTAISLFDGFIKEVKWRNYDGYTRKGMFGHMVIEKHGAQGNLDEDFWNFTMTPDDQRFVDEFLSQDPAVIRRVRFLHVSGLANTGRNNALFIGMGYDVKEGAALRGESWSWNATAGLPLHLAEGDNKIMLGGGLGRFLDCESTYTGKFVTLDGGYTPEERPFTCINPNVTLTTTTEFAQVNALDLKVVGLTDAAFRDADNRMVYIPLTQAQRLLDTDKVSLISVELRQESDAHAVVERFKKANKQAGRDLDGFYWQNHSLADMVRSIDQILAVFRNLFMVVVVTIGVMSVANTMMKSVNERIREIGTLRSIGFYRSHIVTMFTLEGFFISVISCFFGLISTVVLGNLISMSGLTYRAGLLSMPIALRVMPAPLAWIFSSVVLTLLAAFTAWFCARRAANLVIADAMRHV